MSQPAAAGSFAAQALAAAKSPPPTSTDPDADNTHNGFGATDVGAGKVEDPHAAHLVAGSTGAVDLGAAKGSWVTQYIALMWPYIVAAAEKMVWEMVPPMLEAQKPTWMTSLQLHTFKLGAVPPTIEDVKVAPGSDPGAEDVFLEFDFQWKGKQDISLTFNPAPAVLQSLPVLKQIVTRLMTWSVGVEDISLKGRLRTTMIPLLFQMPIIGAVQAGFVDPPKLDFHLTLPAGSHDSGLLTFVEGWLDAFLADSVLSPYVLPDHFFLQVDPSSEDILTPEGVMEVCVLEATDVPAISFIGKGEPFAKLWLRPRSLKHTPSRKGPNPRWNNDEASYAMPVHVRAHQVLTVALLDSGATGSDEIGRAHYNLEQLTPGKTEDLWLDIGVPTKAGGRRSGSSRTKDKIVAALTGARGSDSKDVKDTLVHIQLNFHPLAKSTVAAINAAQMQGREPSLDLIEEPRLRSLVQKFDLWQEMFGNKAGGNRGAGVARK